MLYLAVLLHSSFLSTFVHADELAHAVRLLLL